MVARTIRKVAIIFALLGAAACFALAEGGSKNELGLLLGATVTPRENLTGQSSNIEFGSGMVFQATYARRLTDFRTAALYFEVPFVATPLVDLSSSNVAVPANYAYLFVTPGLRLKFKPNAPASPWISLGGGYGDFEESKQSQDGTAIPRIEASRGTLQFGGGVDFRTPIRILFPIGVRAEVRDFYSGKPDFRINTPGGLQHNLVFSGGLVVHF